MALVGAVHGVALHEDVEVDDGGVELGAVDAGELALIAEQDAAAAAHAGAVDHDGVEADHGADAEGDGDASDGAHHGDGTDGKHEVELAAAGEELVELGGDQALLAVGAVVGEDVRLGAGGADLVLEDDHVAAARAFNKYDVVAGVFEGVGGGEGHGGADAAGEDDGDAVVGDLRGAAERTDNVEDGVAGLQTVEQRSGFADGLGNDGDGSGSGVGGFDGEGDALALVVEAEYDELAGALLARNARRFHDELPDIEPDAAGFHDSVHVVTAPMHRACS